MDTRSPPEISCVLCRKVVDLHADLCADENGKSVHEDCYVQDVAKKLRGSANKP